MSRRIILERSVSVRCWRVAGQIAKAGERAELMPALLRASENDGTDARDLAEHLLFEPRSRPSVSCASEPPTGSSRRRIAASSC